MTVPSRPGSKAGAKAKTPCVAVVGAGLAGLSCARTLADAGLAVTVFEMAPHPGGRMATCATAAGVFDYGAQFFVATDARFAAVVDGWQAAGVAVPWPGLCVTLPTAKTIGLTSSLGRSPSDDNIARFVGTPDMNAIARNLARGLDIQYGTIVMAIRRCGNAWSLHGNMNAVGPFDVVAVATPAPQAVPLLAADGDMAAQVAAVAFDPCWALMVAFASPPPLPFDAARVTGGLIAWMSRNAAKPGRSAANGWTVHASSAWSAAHLKDDTATVIAGLLPELSRITARSLPPITYAAAHRWRFARTAQPLRRPCLFDPSLGLGVCGDWCLGSRLEFAYLSGTTLAERILGNAGIEEANRRR